MNATITREGRTTTAEVSVEGEGVVGVGAAVCDQDDHFVPKIGDGIAIARALQDLGRRLEEGWVARAVTKDELAARRAARVRQEPPPPRRVRSTKEVRL